MALKFIFNGYFRSGTTFVWSVLKQNNHDYNVYYEPLHPKLFGYYLSCKNIDLSLHGLDVWTDYRELPVNNLQKMREKQILTRGIYPQSTNALYDYLDVFDQIPENVILQTNRLHYFYKEICAKYQVMIFHIIRNPLDIYGSIKKRYIQTRTKKQLLRAYILRLRYRIDYKSLIWKAKDNLDYLFEHFETPPLWGNKSWQKRVLANGFKTQFLSWFYANDFAMKNLKGCGYAIKYEDILMCPKKIRYFIEEKSRLSFSLENVIMPSSIHRYDDSQILATAKSLNILDQYNEFLDRLKTMTAENF